MAGKEKKSSSKTEEEEKLEAIRYETLNSITSLGLQFWDGLCVFMYRKDFLTDYQQNFVNTIRGKLKRSGEFSDSEIEKGGIIIDILRKKKFNFKNIESLSNLKTEVKIDTATIYKRIKIISAEDWQRVFAIGEQTQKISYIEINTIDTVQQKIKNKETIDLKQLQMVNDCLDRVKKFGVKV